MEIVQLKDLTDIYLGVTHTPEYVWDGVPFLSVKDISGGNIVFDNCKYISEEEYNSLSEGAKPKVGDMLFCRVGTIGKPIIIPEGTPKFGSFVSLGYLRNKDSSRCKLEYLKHWMNSKSFFQQVQSNVKGASQVNLNTGWLSQFEVPLPELNVQCNIVEILNKCEEVINIRNLELYKLDELIKARFVELFGDPEENPKKWDKIPLSGLIVNANNGMARRGNDEEGNIVIRLVELQDGYIDYSNPNRILLSDNEKKRYLLKDRDFLFARVNGNPDNVGRCAVFHDIGEEVFHNDHIIRVHFDENRLNGTFASALFNSDYGKKQLKSQIKTSAGQYTVSQDGIGAIVTILPRMELQLNFEKFVEQVDKSKVAIQRSLDEAQILFDSLMQEYFG